MSTRLDLPAPLKKALDQGRLSILAGAGVSLWAPSALPGWSAFNNIVLDEVREMALSVAPEAVASSLGQLTLDEIGSKVFSDAVVNDFAGQSYFEILRALDARAFNPCHQAIASLAKRRTVSAVLTTNFDTLIEAAFEAAACPLTVLASPLDYAEARKTHCVLLKIHGTARRSEALIDTVRQKMVGLHQLVRAEIARIIATTHVLVLGFSGDDLEFGGDYLALHAIRPSSPGITWLVRPGSKPSSLVRQAVGRAGPRGTILPADLGALVGRLVRRKVDLRVDEPLRREAESRLRSIAHEVLGRQGPLNALAFGMRLLSTVGRLDVAATVWQHLAATLGAANSQVRSAAGPAFRALAAEAPLLVGPAAQANWASEELNRLQNASGVSAAGIDAMKDEDHRAAATAYIQLTEAYIAVGDSYHAGQTMELAMDHAEWLCDTPLLAAVYSAYGWRAAFREVETTDSIEEALAFLYAAEAAAIIGGDIDTANAVLRRTQVLLEGGEYDAALTSIRRLEQRVDLGVRRDMQMEAEVQKGQIQLRRGRVDAAVATWRACAEKQAANRLGVARVRDVMVSHLGFSPRWRPMVLALCDEAIAAMKAGTLPGDGRLRDVRTQAYYEHARRSLADQRDAAFQPFFVRYTEAPRDSTEEIRRQLMASEYAQDTSGVFECFDLIIRDHYSSGRVERMLECALAQRVIARRMHSEARFFDARANVAAARYWTGDRAKAGPAYGRLYRHRRARGRALAGLNRRLPTALWSQLSPRRATVPQVSMWTRRFSLDGFDALEKKRRRPPTLSELADLARHAMDAREFGMGRVYLFELVGASRAIGDRAHEAQAFELLALGAGVEGRYEQQEALRRRVAELR